MTNMSANDGAIPPLPRPNRDRVDRFFSWIEKLPLGPKILAMICIVVPIYLVGFVTTLLTFVFCAYAAWPYVLETPLLVSIPLLLFGPVPFGAFLVLLNRFSIWQMREHRPWPKAALWRACYARVAWLLTAGQAAALSFFLQDRQEFLYAAVSLAAAFTLMLIAGFSGGSTNLAKVYEELFENEASRIPLSWLLVAFVPMELVAVAFFYGLMKHHNGAP